VEAATIPWTTLERTVLPVPVPATSPKLLVDEVSKYAQYGYGVWQVGAGRPRPWRLPREAAARALL